MNKKRILYLLLTLVMAIIIFWFSSQESEKSNHLSYQIDIQIWKLISKKTESTSNKTNYVENIDSGEELDSRVSNTNLTQKDSKIVDKKEKKTEYPVNDKLFHNIDTVVRKTAHVILYTLFAISLTLWIKTYEIQDRKTILLVLLIGFLYACLDEWNQKIRGTRTGIFKDTLIDTAGCLLGLIIVLGIRKIKNRRSNS